MVKILVNLIEPILTPMGVSRADLQVYIEAISGKLLFAISAVIALIVLLICAKKMRKEWRTFVRGQAVIAFLVVIVFLINNICYHAPIYGPLSSFLNAGAVEINEELSSASLSITERIGAEGFVLLKNEEETLPLSSAEKKLNVFGWASTQPYLGGTGSSAGENENAVGILEALEQAGFEINQTLIGLYTEYAAERPGADMFGQNMTLPEPTVDEYTDAVMKEAKEFSETAVIVIARGGGENYDLPTDMNAVIHGTYNISETVSNNAEIYPYTKVTYTNNGDYDDFDEGESYLELSNTEEAMIQTVCENFEKVILVVNSCNPMELGFAETDAIDAVIYAPAAGAKGFAALGEILNGNINPSGRTADTWVYDLLNTPSSNNIGIWAYTNTDDIKETVLEADATYQGSLSFVNYVEGIYVGYKFYETAAKEGLIDYETVVQYPFGYGLSYTSFEKKITSFEKNEDAIQLEVMVTNTGKRAGRDVVELYYTAPYTDGGIEKAEVNLLDFVKTESLSAGESQLVNFEISIEDMASYDSEGKKLVNGGYILEAGEYQLSIRSDSHTVDDSCSFTVENDLFYNETGRTSDQLAAVNQFEEYSRGDFVQLSRAGGFANYEKATAAPVSKEMDNETKEAVMQQLWGYYDADDYVKEDQKPNAGEKNGLTLADMTEKDYADSSWDQLLDQMKTKELEELVNNGGWKTVEISSIEKLDTSDSDGPAGLNNYLTGSSGTTFPAEILMAQTWSKEVARLIGDTIGQEFAAADNYGWYGPAMNLHRSAFGGRNFEYYSEDAVLSGMIASEEVNGAAQYGVYAYLKHFALNDQELARTAVLLTYASEQTIREIYLKPFEYTIKNFDGKALAIMSSYNFIGTKYAGANPELLQTVLRDEWGFKGMVISDYDGSYGYMITDAIIRNGGDLMLGYGSYDTNKLNTKKASVQLNLRRAAKNILYTIANSGYYTGENIVDTENEKLTENIVLETDAMTENALEDISQNMSNMDRLFCGIDISVGVFLFVLEVILVVMQIHKKKNAKKTA